MQQRTPPCSHPLMALLILLSGIAFSQYSAAADPLAVRYYEDAVSRFNAGDARGAMIQLKNVLQRDPAQLSAKILLGRTYLLLDQPAVAEEQLLEAGQLGADPLLIALDLARARNELRKYEEVIENLVPIDFPRSQQPDIWVELGHARLGTEDPDGARIAFEEALRIRQDHVGARVGLAQIPLQQNDFALAMKLAEDALGLDPESADAWFAKGSAAHGAGDYRVAAEAYGRAHELDPRNLQAGIGEAAALMDADKPAMAAALLRSLRNTHPESPAIPYLLSQALDQIGRREDAKQALSQAAELVGNFSPADITHRPADLLLFGSIVLENGELEQAYQFLSAYVDGGGPEIRGRKMLGRTLISLGRPGDALRVLVRISANEKEDAETLQLMGDANIQLGDFEAAERLYRDALQNHQGGPGIVRRLGVAQFRGGQRDRGLETLKGLAEQIPEGTDVNTSLLLGFLYLAEGQLVEAEGIARSVLAQAPDNKIARNFLATVFAAQGKPAQAREIYTRLRAEAPGFRPAQYNLIKLDIAEGRLAQASAELRQILAIDPDDSQALYESARVAMIEGDTRAAIQLLERLRALRPAWVAAVQQLVEAYLIAGKTAEAVEVAMQLDKTVPKNVAVQKLLARSQIAAGDRRDARATLRKASLLAGNDARQLLDIGRRQRQLGALEDSVWSLTKAVAIEPDAVEARIELATGLLLQRKFPEAELEVARIRKDAPETLVADILLADIRLAQGRFDAAVELYRETLAKTDDPAVAVSLHSALSLGGKRDEATRLLLDWLQTHPDDTRVMKVLAEQYLVSGDTASALPLYERLATLRPGDPQILNNLAIALGDVDNERALKAALAAHEISPDSPFVLDTLGWSLVQIGDLNKGLGYLREARARRGGSATIRYHLGVALQEFGNYREAARELREALRLSGTFPEREDARARLQQLELMGN